MRKFAVLIGGLGLMLVGLVAAPAARAGNINLTLNSTTPSSTTFTISGTYATSGIPTTPMSGDGLPYSMSFTIQTNPSTLSSFSANSASGFFDVDATLSFSFDGGASMPFSTPFAFEFDTNTGGNLGGLVFCFNMGGCSSGTFWNIIGQQLFTGSVSNPTFISTANASVNQTMSSYTISGAGPFPFGTAPTPEPASLFLLGTGLFGLGFVTRKKLRLR